MSWNGRDIVYQVSPGVRHRMVKGMLEDAPIMDEIYQLIKKSGAFDGKRVVLLMSPDGYSKIPSRWRRKGKIDKLFGVPVEIDENQLINYRYNVI